MPLVRIETRRGLTPAQKQGLLDGVHAALMEAFKIPDHDRAQRIAEYAPEDFEIPPGKGPRFTIVTIDAFPGRSLDAKRALYQGIVTRFDAVGIPKADVFIVLHEPPLDSWGMRGGVPGSEVDIGFSLKV